MVDDECRWRRLEALRCELDAVGRQLADVAAVQRGSREIGLRWARDDGAASRADGTVKRFSRPEYPVTVDDGAFDMPRHFIEPLIHTPKTYSRCAVPFSRMTVRRLK